MPEYVQDSVEDMRYILNLMSDVRFACLQGSCTKEEAFEMISDILVASLGRQDVDYAGRIAAACVMDHG